LIATNECIKCHVLNKKGDVLGVLNFVKKDELSEAGKWLDMFIGKVQVSISEAKSVSGKNLVLSDKLNKNSNEVLDKLQENVSMIKEVNELIKSYKK